MQLAIVLLRQPGDEPGGIGDGQKVCREIRPSGPGVVERGEFGLLSALTMRVPMLAIPRGNDPARDGTIRPPRIAGLIEGSPSLRGARRWRGQAPVGVAGTAARITGHKDFKIPAEAAKASRHRPDPGRTAQPLAPADQS